MNSKIIAGIGAAIAIGIIVAIIGMGDFGTNTTPVASNNNDKLGLVINTPQSSITLEELDEIYQKASSSGIGRSNIYMFWNLIEPEREQYDWKQYDRLMGFNEKNNLKVTLYFSIINGKTLGPFPDWIGNPSLKSISEDNLVNVLDSVLSRYHIVDSVIIAAGTDEHFRYQERDIPVYEELFDNVYERIKEKHPDVKIGNSFELHNALNKDLEDIVKQLTFGDFVAFTYLPTDTLNEIDKTPTEAIQDLEKLKEIIPDKKIGIFEISWATSQLVEGSTNDQTQFIQELYNFYEENEEDIEFLTWYRLYDRPEGSCEIDESKIEGEVTLGNSTFVIERLGNYICSAGLLEIDDDEKSGWTELSNQIKSLT